LDYLDELSYRRSSCTSKGCK